MRFFNVYGPDQRDDFVISKFKKNINDIKPIKIFGNGKQIRAFCHVDDAAKAVNLVISKGKKIKYIILEMIVNQYKLLILQKKWFSLLKKELKF